jgi:hypothetical protein
VQSISTSIKASGARTRERFPSSSSVSHPHMVSGELTMSQIDIAFLVFVLTAPSAASR